jgi:hypothetical protein
MIIGRHPAFRLSIRLVRLLIGAVVVGDLRRRRASGFGVSELAVSGRIRGTDASDAAASGAAAVSRVASCPTMAA